MNIYQFSICKKNSESRIQLNYIKKIFGITVLKKEVGNIPEKSSYISSLIHRIMETNNGPISICFNNGTDMNNVLSTFAYMTCAAELDKPKNALKTKAQVSKTDKPAHKNTKSAK